MGSVRGCKTEPLTLENEFREEVSRESLLDAIEMAEYRSSSHTVYDIKYHFVWITKYRYKILRRKVAFRLLELLQQECEARNINRKCVVMKSQKG